MRLLNSTALFTEVWKDAEAFRTEYRNSGLNKEAITDDSLNIIYYEIYANHGNDYIKYRDKHQWTYKVFSIIHNDGVKWQVSRLKQEELENLSEDEIIFGGKTTTNASSNPSVADQSNDNDSGLASIDNQNVNISKMNKAIAYAGYIATLRDVTTEFIKKFDNLFSINVCDPGAVLYENDEEEDDY